MSEFRSFRPVPPFTLPLEGRLMAHRRLLVELMRALPEDRRAGMMEWLDEHRIYRDGEDETGAVLGEGIELELARADEIQVLKRMVEGTSE